MKAWRFYAFGDMRLDDIELAKMACPPDHVLVEPLVVQPSATEAQLAFGPRKTASNPSRTTTSKADWSPQTLAFGILQLKSRLRATNFAPES